MKVVIHNEYEVTDCRNCPYYEMQHDTGGGRNDSWPMCVLPYCILDGSKKLIKGNCAWRFVDKFGIGRLNELYKECGLLWDVETHVIVRKNGEKILDEKKLT